MLKEFRDFIMRGNLIDIAIGLVMALAFKAIVDALVNNILMPFIAAIFGQPSFDSLTVTVNDAVIPYGTFITASVNFLLIAAALFFLVIKPLNMWAARRAEAQEPAPEPEPGEEIVLLREIRDRLTLR